MAILSCCALPPAAWAGDPAAADRQAKLLLRVLSYDHALESWSGGRLRIGVIHGASPPSPEHDCESIQEALASSATYTVKKLPVEVVEVPIDVGSIEQLVAAHRINVFFLCPSVRGEIDQVLRFARAHRIAVLGGERGQSAQGVAVVVVIEEGRPKMLINVPAAQRHGHRFAVQLMKLAELTE
jgi:hypothetical protein